KVWPANNSPSPASVVIWFQEKEWTDELEIENWIRYWNNRWPGF
ncbi:5484_t:CDS:1, partial [Gigaspora margarita]